LLFAILAGLLVFAVGIEMLIEHVEKWLERALYRHLFSIVKNELLALGLLSFMLFFLNNGSIHVIKTHANHLCVEFIHFMLFIGMMYYVIFTTMICLVLDLNVRHWERWEHMELDLENIPDDIVNMGISAYFLNKKKRKRYHHYRYKLIVQDFTLQNAELIAEGLKEARLVARGKSTAAGTDVNGDESAGEEEVEFRFHVYLQHGLEHVLCEICEVGWIVWAVLLLLAGMMTVVFALRHGYGAHKMEGQLMGEPYPMFSVPSDDPFNRANFDAAALDAVSDNSSFMTLLFFIAYR
jgi:hypothetical protein